MYTFLLATTNQTGLQQAESLLAASWQCRGVLTSRPRPVGRHQTLTPTPAHLWADEHHLPIFLLEKTIPKSLSRELPAVDFVLVVDFGYYVPSWLIAWSKYPAINIHPSRLPHYRGASPGQYVILNGDSDSAVSIMTLAREMDAGPLLAQLPLSVAKTWTSQEYYDHAFRLAAQKLPQILNDFATGKISPQEQIGTPTFAPKISKQDAFITPDTLFSPTTAVDIERKIRAYQPWPLAWTVLPLKSGLKVRLQLLHAHLENNHLILDEVKIAGQKTKTWSQVAPLCAI